jgi:hypothetical protein
LNEKIIVERSMFDFAKLHRSLHPFQTTTKIGDELRIAPHHLARNIGVDFIDASLIEEPSKQTRTAIKENVGLPPTTELFK